MKKREGKLSLAILVLVLIFSINNIAFSEGVYKDMDQISSWAKADVLKATEKSYIQGAEGKFKPKSKITNAEYIKMVMEFLEIPMEDIKNNPFKNVTENDWYFKYMVNGRNKGIIKGNDSIDPKAPINREDMAVILRNALEFKGVSTSNNQGDFKDLSEISKEKLEAVKTVNSLDLIKGDGGYYRPKDQVTREMSVVVLMRTRGLLNQGKAPMETGKKEELDLRPYIEETGRMMYTSIPEASFGTGAGEWTVMDLARANIKVPEGYYDRYYKNVERVVAEKKNNLHRIKYTEHSRLILALSAINKDVTNVAGYNQLEKLADFNTLIKQGVNGPIFALIALDTKNYEIPIVEGVKIQTTREMLIDYILGREIESTGGWALGSNPKTIKADPDITGMAIQALAPYYNKRSDVKEAVDRGVKWLSEVQREDGGYYSWGSVNSESCVQVIVALTSIGIDPHKDPRFIKNGKSVVDALMSHYYPGGGFVHVKAGEEAGGGPGEGIAGELNGMATDQGMYGMIAYDRFIKGENTLYDMTDAMKNN